VKYHGIRPDDPEARGFANPERGWRIETKMADLPAAAGDKFAHHLRSLARPDDPHAHWVFDARKYAPFGLRLAQCYFYLDEFIDSPISNARLAQLRDGLARLRAEGLKALLRFAYERGMKHPGPTAERIIAHLDQLEPIIRENVDVIYVLQAGLVGAWGEWHASAHGIEKDPAALAAIVDRLLRALPDSRCTQVRAPKFKQAVLGQAPLGPMVEVTAETARGPSPAARIGFHNDGFLARHDDGWTWPEPPHFANPGNPQFDYMTRECPFVPVDGEMFWGDSFGTAEGWAGAQRLRLHHYSSLSLAHSYSLREGRPLAIDQWMRTPISLQQVRSRNMPAADGYFEDAWGAAVPRTAFEYITDHLGYRLELQHARWPEALVAGAELEFEAELVNRGFAAPVNHRPVLLAFIDAAGRAKSIELDADVQSFQPFQPGDETYAPLTHTLSLRAPLPQEIGPGLYQLGLWLPDESPELRDDSRYAIRLANRDTLWLTGPRGQGQGINLLGLIEVRQQ
jgi:hypothetical protein